MALTVGDIRKALAKYSDDTIVAAGFGDDFSPFESICPVKKTGAIKIKKISLKDLFIKPWLKADLTGKKVISIEYEPEYSDEFFAEKDEDRHPFWKPMQKKQDKEIRKMKPFSDYCSGQLFY